MENRKLNKNISKIDFDSINIDKYVESDIDEYIKYFNIDEESKNKIIIPTDLKKNVKEPFKEVKREKRKNIRYTFLDLIIVAIILLPVGGIINPKLFENLPTVYPVFKKINKAIQIDNIKSMMGIDNKEVIEGSADSSVETIFIEEKDISEPRNNNEAIKLIHSLANTLIKAEYKWQCSEVTPKTIKLAIKGVEKISDDYDRIVDLFDAYNKSYSLHALAKIIKTDDLTTLQNTLTSLEEQGKVYFNEDENKYQPFPKQYKIVTIETGKKGFYYIRNKDSIYPLKDEETIGILPFDKVILEKNNDGFNIIKVLKRNNPRIICEVTEKGIRVVGNNNIKVRCNEKEFKELKLPVGTRILVKIGTKETNKVYDVSFIEVTGHKNDLTSELEAIACNNGCITR